MPIKTFLPKNRTTLRFLNQATLSFPSLTPPQRDETVRNRTLPQSLSQQTRSSASTQSTVLNAIVFLQRHVLKHALIPTLAKHLTHITEMSQTPIGSSPPTTHSNIIKDCVLERFRLLSSFISTLFLSSLFP